MTRFAAVVALLCGCSYSMATIDPAHPPTTEPTCSEGTVLLDRVVGVSLLLAGIGTFSANPNEPGALVSAGAVIPGLVYMLAAANGARKLTDCHIARTRWTYSNAIKPRAPAPAAAKPARPPAAPAPPASGRPWAAGVSERAQAKALELYAAGNREFIETRWSQALAKYREAIEHWDHPSIRFNMAVCLIHLDQIVEAREDLERSLRYGGAALGADAHAQALTHRKLLDGQLARLTLDCPEPDEEVMVDGKLVFKGPGTVELFLRPGEHQLVATKPGFLPASKKIVLAAGASATFEIRPLIDPRP